MNVPIFSDLHGDVHPIKPITILPGVRLAIVASDTCEGAIRAFEYLRRIDPLHILTAMVLGKCNPHGCAAENHTFNDGMVVKVG